MTLIQTGQTQDTADGESNTLYLYPQPLENIPNGKKGPTGFCVRTETRLDNYTLPKTDEWLNEYIVGMWRVEFYAKVEFNDSTSAIFTFPKDETKNLIFNNTDQESNFITGNSPVALVDPQYPTQTVVFNTASIGINQDGSSEVQLWNYATDENGKRTTRPTAVFHATYLCLNMKS